MMAEASVALSEHDVSYSIADIKDITKGTATTFKEHALCCYLWSRICCRKLSRGVWSPVS